MKGLLWGGLVWAQLTGTYLVNGSTNPVGGTFATLQEALDVLAAQGAQDTVRLRVVAPYDPTAEPSTIQVKPYACNNCAVIVLVDTSVTIAKAPVAQWQTGGQFVLRILGGVQNFVLNGRGQLRLKSLTDTTALTGVVGIVPRAGAPVSNIQIDSCVLEGHSRGGTWAALYVGDSASYTLQPVVAGVSQVKVRHCVLRSARYGAVLLSGGWGGVTQVTFEGDTFGYPTATLAEAENAWGGGGAALYARYVMNLQLLRNTAQGAWETGPYTPVGFKLEGCHTATLRANRIWNLRSLSPDGYGAIGLYLVRDPRYGPSPHLVENNFIGGLSGGADESLPGSSVYAVAGILLESAFQPDPNATFTLRHNTVHLSGAAQSSAPWAKDGFSAAIIVGRNIRGGVELRGNLLQNTLVLSSTLAPDAKEATALLFWENPGALLWSTFLLDGNFYFVRGPAPERTSLARLGAGDSVLRIGSLAAWRLLTGGEASSRWGLTGPAPFLALDQPHLDPTSPWEGINAAPAPPLVSEDWDGQPRPLGGGTDPGTGPDMGADELAGTLLPCPGVQSAPLLPSLTSGLCGEPVTLSVSDPAALAGELALLQSLDGGLSWQALPVVATQFPLTVPLPKVASFPAQVHYTLVAYPLAGCPGVPDTAPPIAITLQDRPGNRPETAVPVALSSVAPGVWQAARDDSLTGYGTTDVFSPLRGDSVASRSPDLFFLLTLPACVDSLEVDLCGPQTDFDTRLHLIAVGDTFSDRDQGPRLDCTPNGVAAAYTSRIVATASLAAGPRPAEDFGAPARVSLPLPPGQTLLLVVEGETTLEVGRFSLKISAYSLPLTAPDLGPDRSVCYDPAGVTLSVWAPAASRFAWWVDGSPFPGTDSVIRPILDPGAHEIVVEAQKVALQPCAGTQSLRDTLQLMVLPEIGAYIQEGGQVYPSGDTLVRSFGTYTFTAGAAASGVGFTWQVLNAQLLPIYTVGGPTLTYEFGARGLYGVLLESQAGACREADTLYLKVQPAASTLGRGEAAQVRLWSDPTDGSLWAAFPDGGPYHVQVLDLTGRRLLEGTFAGQTVSRLLAYLPPALYAVQVHSPEGSQTWLWPHPSY
ncbi:MAG: hypothetical protein KatS3mg026_0524 [Bacteroidia bacterium]|nr:MAG: hypothetical protein KatS3mg026_0524 [Bacteroidia bacterium]